MRFTSRFVWIGLFLFLLQTQPALCGFDPFKKNLSPDINRIIYQFLPPEELQKLMRVSTDFRKDVSFHRISQKLNELSQMSPTSDKSMPSMVSRLGSEGEPQPEKMSLTAIDSAKLNSGRASVLPWSLHITRDASHTHLKRRDLIDILFQTAGRKYNQLTENHSILSDMNGVVFYKKDGSIQSYSLCHSWSPASISIAENPRPIRIKREDGKTIEFSQSDLKALLQLTNNSALSNRTDNLWSPISRTDIQRSWSSYWGPSTSYQSRVDSGSNLSPAEKFDLMMDDSDFKLSSKMLEAYSQQRSKENSVESLAKKKLTEYVAKGFYSPEITQYTAAGWALASLWYPKPVKSVQASGIQFSPAELEILASSTVSKTLENQFLDRKNLTLSPAEWHQLVIQQIGVNHQGFPFYLKTKKAGLNRLNFGSVFPAYAYRYFYFNPKTFTFHPNGTLESSSVEISDLPLAAEAKSPDARFSVGVVMELSFAVPKIIDSSKSKLVTEDDFRNIHIFYSLQLNQNSEVVGGHWYSENHPLWAWIPNSAEKIITPGDEWLEKELAQTGQIQKSEWNISQKLPSSWQKANIEAVNYVQPLGRIIDQLMDAAR